MQFIFIFRTTVSISSSMAPVFILSNLEFDVPTAAKLLQSCPTHRDLIDCSPPGSSIHGIFQARVLEWGAIAFSESLTEIKKS